MKRILSMLLSVLIVFITSIPSTAIAEYYENDTDQMADEPIQQEREQNIEDTPATDDILQEQIGNEIESQPVQDAGDTESDSVEPPIIDENSTSDVDEANVSQLPGNETDEGEAIEGETGEDEATGSEAGEDEAGEDEATEGGAGEDETTGNETTEGETGEDEATEGDTTEDAVTGQELEMGGNVEDDSVGIGDSQELDINENISDMLEIDVQDGVISPFSGFEDEENTFLTHIQLYVADQDNKPMSGIIYGLHRAEDNTLVTIGITNSEGFAFFNNLPSDIDYYLLEITSPEGYQRNTERKDIILKDTCSPSLIDISVRYDIIMGKIRILKKDESGSFLPDVGFTIYRDGEKVETIITDDMGVAFSSDLPYGTYQIYEHLVPNGFIGSGWTTAEIRNHDEIVDIEIINRYGRGSLIIHKRGNDDRLLSDVVFEVYRADDDSFVTALTTSSGYSKADSLKVGDYYFIEKSSAAGYIPDTTTKHYFSVLYDKQEVIFNITNNRDGSSGKLRVIKTDDNNNPLSDVVFGLYRAWDDKKLAELITGSDGIVESGTLIPEEYYLIELVVKDGYSKVTGKIPFTIDGTGSVVEKTVINPKLPLYGKVQVTKRDDASTLIQGVRFGIYDNLDNLVDEMTTGFDGKATSNSLGEGDYYIMELETVSGYLLDTTRYPFSITVNGAIVPISVVNQRITGGIRVIKTDGTNALPGVVFGIYRQGIKVAEITTDAFGVAVSGALYYGGYELRELQGLAGYVTNTSAVPFTISEHSRVIEIPVTNQRINGSIKIIKTATDGTTRLPGVVFGIYRGGTKIDELTTGLDGTVTSGTLDYGNYELRELSTISGYVLDSTPISFSITTHNTVVQIPVSNQRESGNVKIIKTDGTNPIPGVVFGIYKGSTKVAEITTGSNGEVTSGILECGNYELRELSGFDGFLQLTSPIPFTITYHGEIVEIPVVNEPITGGIKVIKTDGVNPLSNVVFGIYKQGAKIAELTTGADGTATSDTLGYGSYELIELSTVEGYELIQTPIPFSITDHGVILEINVTNSPIIEPEETPPNETPPEETPPEETPPEETPSTQPEPTPSPGEPGEIQSPNQSDNPDTSVYIISSGKARIIKTDAESGEKLPGAVFGVYMSGNDIKVTELTTNSDGTAITPELPIGEYYLKELTAPDGYAISDTKHTIRIKAGETVEITITNSKAEKGGFVNIVKKAQGTGERLMGAVFGIYRASDNQQVAELTTGSDGIVGSQALPVGEYYVKELKAPDGYESVSDEIRFGLKNGETKEITVVNVPISIPEPVIETGELLIIKRDLKTDELLENAVFGVFLGSEKVCELTTKEDGTVVVSLPAGEYGIVELTPPSGYLPVQERVDFQIVANETTDIIVYNTAIEEPPTDTGVIRVVKKAEGTGERLSGAVFGLYRVENDEKAAELVTDSDGIAETQPIPQGEYYLREITAPEGYVIMTDVIRLNVKMDETKEITVTNAPVKEAEFGNLLIVKKSEKTGETLEDVIFGIYRTSDDEKLSEVTTDSVGNARLTLSPDRYYLRELRVPESYKLEPSKIHFTVKNDETVRVDVTNMRAKGTLKLIKTGPEGEAISGAVFEIYEQDGSKITEIITGESGTAVYDLPLGSYYLIEKSVPQGYKLDTTKRPFAIEEDETEVMEITNEAVKGTVEIYFRHVQDGREVIETITFTGNSGEDYREWMRENGLEGMAIDNYRYVRTDYPAELTVIDGVLVVTLWYDDVPAAPVVADGRIYIPQTGEPLPVMNWLMSAILICLAGILGITLYRKRKNGYSMC